MYSIDGNKTPVMINISQNRRAPEYIDSQYPRRKGFLIRLLAAPHNGRINCHVESCRRYCRKPVQRHYGHLIRYTSGRHSITDVHRTISSIIVVVMTVTGMSQAIRFPMTMTGVAYGNIEIIDRNEYHTVASMMMKLQYRRNGNYHNCH